jgi:hypothetical protein
MDTGVMKFAFNWLQHHGNDARCKKHFRSESAKRSLLASWSPLLLRTHSYAHRRRAHHALAAAL